LSAHIVSNVGGEKNKTKTKTKTKTKNNPHILNQKKQEF
jgi:hypothetical protein